jgi:uncharacterized membrane protein
MNILIHHFSSTAQIIAWLLFAATLALAVWRAPWYHLKEAESLHILLGMVVGIMVIWTLKAGLQSGLSIHLLGTTLLTLMFGWAFAILGIVVVLLAHAIQSGAGWADLPMNALLLGALPALLSYLIFRAVDRYLPNNFFVYIFLNAFFGAAIAVAGAVFVTSLVHIASGAYPASLVWYSYTRYVPLVMFPEGFITGMLMTLFIAYRPEWVSTFDDDRYIKDK